VVLGFESIEDYEKHSPYFGAVVGRVAGRIKGGTFTLEGTTYHVTKNENSNHLHGGHKGFSHVFWDTQAIKKEDSVSIEFFYRSPDGEEGYPGNLEMKMVYTLDDENRLTIAYHGKSDRTTPVNVTNHTYFNLSGNLKRDILDHVLTMKSSRFLELETSLLPTGRFLNVEGTPFDFRGGRRLADGIMSDHDQIRLAGNGYDHPFLLDRHFDQEIVLCDERSGRKLVVETDQPGVVLYTANQLDGDFMIRGVPARKYLGLCLETQGLPDAVHHPHFPSIVLEKGKVYQAKTTYIFSVM
jgi:aldose 1-epimerase